MHFVSFVKLLRNVGIHYPGVIPVDEGTERVVPLEKVGLGSKTQPANNYSDAMHHRVIFALAIKMCAPTYFQTVDRGINFKVETLTAQPYL